MVYSGRDKASRSDGSYQRILKCNACSAEYTED
jgi:hypothetical protein